jgi:hypothetical protein
VILKLLELFGLDKPANVPPTLAYKLKCERRRPVPREFSIKIRQMRCWGWGNHRTIRFSDNWNEQRNYFKNEVQNLKAFNKRYQDLKKTPQGNDWTRKKFFYNAKCLHCNQTARESCPRTLCGHCCKRRCSSHRN